jgi:hypothetical protein
LWPSLGFALVAAPLGRWRAGLLLASVVGFVLAGFFWTGYLMMFESALGFAQSQLKLVALAPLVWALIPLFAQLLERSGERPRLGLALASAAAALVAASSVAALLPATSVDCPRGQNVVYVDDGEQPPRWMIQSVDRPDASYLAAAKITNAESSFLSLGLYPIKGWLRPATAIDVPPPSFTPTSDTTTGERRVLTGTLHLGANMIRAGLSIAEHSGVLGLRVEGQPVWTEDLLRDDKLHTMRFVGLRNRDLAVELTLAKGAKGPVAVYEISSLPESSEGRALQSARPGSATPFGLGDQAFLARKIGL